MTMTETPETAPATPPPDPTELANAVTALIYEIRDTASMRERSEPGIVGKLGGRKFIGVLVFTAILVTFDLLRLPVAPATQEILLWLYVAFVGGNAVEHTVRSKGGAA